jgi:hypothetical protein
MHTTHIVSSLYLCIIALFSLFHGVAPTTDAVPSAQLLPDGFFAFGNYEVLSTHERGDEDVVHIRKRAEGDDCGSDCLTYSGWQENGVLECNAANDQGTSDDEDEVAPEKVWSIGSIRGRAFH